MSSTSELLYQRLDEVHMSPRDRMRARAHLERAEAIAELLVGASAAIGRFYRKVVARPLGRIVTHIG